MNEKVFRLIDAINRCGIDNAQWGVKENVEDTKYEFGTTKVNRLEGKWLYIYTDDEGNNEVTEHSPSVKPDVVCRLDGCFSKESRVCFYKLEESSKFC